MSLLKVMESAKKDKKLAMDEDTYVAKGDVVETISTGSIIIDKLLGPDGKTPYGLGRGRIAEIYGLESSGKTSLALHVAKEIQKLGGNVCFVDFEAALDRTYAEKGIGVDISPERFAHLRPMTLEEGCDVVEYLLDRYSETKIDCLIIDSIKAMTPKAVLEGSMLDMPPMAIQARMVGNFLSKLIKKIKDTKTCVILLNQMTKNIKSNPYQSGGEFETPGGLAVRFYASTRIQLKKTKTEFLKGVSPITNEETEIPDTNVTRVQVIKNKIGMPYGSAEVFIKFGKGIDNRRSIIELALNHNIINQAGAWFTYKENAGGFRFQGKDSMLEFLNKPENKALVMELADRLAFKQNEETKQIAKTEEELDQKAEKNFSSKKEKKEKVEK